VKHFASPGYWKLYHALKPELKRRADLAFRLLKENPGHHSLRFEKKGAGWSARVSQGYRALAFEHPEGLVWFWIGPHDEYERLIPLIGHR